MDGTTALTRLTDQPVLDALAKPLSQAVRGAYRAAGPTGQRVKNALHGVWLGHPLHPVFTALPLGAWTTGLVLDAMAARNHDGVTTSAADVAIAVGLAGAGAAAATGLTDWSETSGRPRRTGLLHGLLNVAATTLYATAYILRKNGSRGTGRTCALAGFSVAIGAAWLGGDLVYDQRIGVTHAAVDGPESFTAVARTTDVPEDSMRRVNNGDADLLLVRKDGKVCALAHPCAHMGGPLSEGTLKDESVVCPWHGSEFHLSDGHVINGPATQSQPCFDVREETGEIQVRASTNSF
jgi:nitrite reductase/ring-hydroxylating ferredoxin subunit/uncharacterized membrane protein